MKDVMYFVEVNSVNIAPTCVCICHYACAVIITIQFLNLFCHIVLTGFLSTSNISKQYLMPSCINQASCFSRITTDVYITEHNSFL